MSARTALTCCVALTLGCGTAASPGGGDSNLPSGRGGPYRLLDGDEVSEGTCLLREQGVTFEDPSALALDARRVALYFTRREGARRTVRRAVVVDGRRVEAAPVEALAPTLAWHGEGVGAPDVASLRDGLAMAYDTSGGLGIATSADGLTWRSDEQPALTADATAGEVTALRSPALLALREGVVMLAYESAGSIWLATADTVAGPWQRVDAIPETPRRDPVVAPGDDARDAGVVGFASGAVGDPSLRLEEVGVGRRLYRLFFSARSAPVAVDGGSTFSRAIGVAGSFDGVHFPRAETPALTGRPDPAVRAPSTWSNGPLRTWLFVTGRCDGAGRSEGIRVGVSPGNRRYDLAP